MRLDDSTTVRRERPEQSLREGTRSTNTAPAGDGCARRPKNPLPEAGGVRWVVVSFRRGRGRVRGSLRMPIGRHLAHVIRARRRRNATTTRGTLRPLRLRCVGPRRHRSEDRVLSPRCAARVLSVRSAGSATAPEGRAGATIREGSCGRSCCRVSKSLAAPQILKGNV
jgi:hypothetical protein